MNCKDTPKPLLTLRDIKTATPYTIYFAGDSVVTIDFGNRIDESINENVISLYNYIRQYPPEAMMDVIPAYSSLSVCFDLVLLKKHLSHETDLVRWMTDQLESVVHRDHQKGEKISNLVRI